MTAEIFKNKPLDLPFESLWTMLAAHPSDNEKKTVRAKSLELFWDNASSGRFEIIGSNDARISTIGYVINIDSSNNENDVWQLEINSKLPAFIKIRYISDANSTGSASARLYF